MTDHASTLHQHLLDAARLRALTRLHLGVAHDLRAPLNAIALNLANLKHALAEAAELPEREEHRYTVELMEEELRRLQRSVEALLQQTEPSAEGAETMDVRSLLADLELLVRPQARQQRLRLEVELPGEPATVVARRDRVQQAILSLLVNAVEATPRDGVVTVELQVVPDWVEVTVRDTGAGIPEDLRDRLFEGGPGSGLGLVVARAAAEDGGGTLELVGTGLEGSEFRLRLPRAKGAALGHRA
ncbi:MAG TPA: HAMP domain-containing sensor histidine kinase [Candidatus Sulfomarinibacteraceae bacterium]|nr:HAMP domain-containing sensor histidine kinase [Candidatus Sulfomarinibacteraceae bacterium]